MRLRAGRVSGTAIVIDPSTAALYQDYALGAATRGRLRLHLLELDGVLVAADLGCSFAGGAFLVKTSYSEDHARLSPGLVLRAEVLRSTIAEGCSFYDFLGAPQPYKLRWSATPSTRWTVDGYRAGWRPIATYHSRIRPLLKAARDRARRGGGLGGGQPQRPLLSPELNGRAPRLAPPQRCDGLAPAPSDQLQWRPRATAIPGR